MPPGPRPARTKRKKPSHKHSWAQTCHTDGHTGRSDMYWQCWHCGRKKPWPGEGRGELI